MEVLEDRRQSFASDLEEGGVNFRERLSQGGRYKREELGAADVALFVEIGNVRRNSGEREVPYTGNLGDRFSALEE